MRINVIAPVADCNRKSSNKCNRLKGFWKGAKWSKIVSGIVKPSPEEDESAVCSSLERRTASKLEEVEEVEDDDDDEDAEDAEDADLVVVWTCIFCVMYIYVLFVKVIELVHLNKHN